MSKVSQATAHVREKKVLLGIDGVYGLLVLFGEQKEELTRKVKEIQRSLSEFIWRVSPPIK